MTNIKSILKSGIELAGLAGLTAGALFATGVIGPTNYSPENERPKNFIIVNERDIGNVIVDAQELFPETYKGMRDNDAYKIIERASEKLGLSANEFAIPYNPQ